MNDEDEKPDPLSQLNEALDKTLEKLQDANSLYPTTKAFLKALALFAFCSSTVEPCLPSSFSSRKRAVISTVRST